jgi:hypothetical protein
MVDRMTTNNSKFRTGRRVWISAAVVALAAIGALAVIVFDVNWRGHYVFCGLDGCLSATAVGRFSVPFAFLFVKYVIVLFGLWFLSAMIMQIKKNRARGDWAN